MPRVIHALPALSVLLTACASAPTAPFDAESTASPPAADGAAPVLVSVWLLDGWPKPEGFDFRIDPVATDLGGLDPVSSSFRADGLPPNTYLLTAEGLATLERDMDSGEHVHVVTAPRLLVEAGQDAAVTIGSADEPTPAFHLALRAVPTSAGTEVSWRCETSDPPAAPTAIEAVPYLIPAGQASATLMGTRPGGGWRLLVVKAEGVGSADER